MVKIFTEPSIRGRWAYHTNTTDNVNFVKHLLGEEGTLKELKMVISEGYKLHDSHFCLDHDFEQFGVGEISVVLESGSQIDCPEAIANLNGRGVKVVAQPSTLIVYQRPADMPRSRRGTPSGPSLMVTEKTTWTPPEDPSDLLLGIEKLFENDARSSVAKGKKRQFSRMLKGFGGCRFVERKGMYCRDCNQVIVYTKRHLLFPSHHLVPCRRCGGSGGTKYVEAIELRKQRREERRIAGELESDYYSD
jgi:hypothetical protein